MLFPPLQASLGPGLDRMQIYDSTPVDTQDKSLGSGHWKFASLLENFYPQDAESTFGWTDPTPVSYHEFQEDAVFSSEADLQE